MIGDDGPFAELINEY